MHYKRAVVARTSTAWDLFVWVQARSARGLNAWARVACGCPGPGGSCSAAAVAGTHAAPAVAADDRRRLDFVLYGATRLGGLACAPELPPLLPASAARWRRKQARHPELAVEGPQRDRRFAASSRHCAALLPLRGSDGGGAFPASPFSGLWCAPCGLLRMWGRILVTPPCLFPTAFPCEGSRGVLSACCLSSPPSALPVSGGFCVLMASCGYKRCVGKKNPGHHMHQTLTHVPETHVSKDLNTWEPLRTRPGCARISKRSPPRQGARGAGSSPVQLGRCACCPMASRPLLPPLPSGRGSLPSCASYSQHVLFFLVVGVIWTSPALLRAMAD